MAVIVLVHGAWLGGWVWKLVSPLLEAEGHRVLTPTLTGLGERSHLNNPEVGLSTHVQDIVNVLEYENLKDVSLVGHSYAGMVITGVADRAPDRLSQLIYLDAFVPESGQSLQDLLPPAARIHNAQLVRTQGDGWRLPLEAQWRTAPAGLLPWMQARWTDQPLKSFEERLTLSRPGGAGLPRSYIRCTQNPVTGWLFEQFAEDPDWRVLELSAGHMAMVSAPAELAEALLSLVETWGPGSCEEKC
jgi:pimeloyl-ACP methyl ester carboxylesterase